jgi:hypothetical protein
LPTKPRDTKLHSSALRILSRHQQPLWSLALQRGPVPCAVSDTFRQDLREDRADNAEQAAAVDRRPQHFRQCDD